MADKQKVDLGLLEEDDEFEEFPAESKFFRLSNLQTFISILANGLGLFFGFLSLDWGTEDADDEDVSVWEDNWEDDIVQDDFSQQLRLVVCCRDWLI